MTNFGPVVEEFVKNSPVAWQAICANVSAEGGMAFFLAVSMAVMAVVTLILGCLIGPPGDAKGAVIGMLAMTILPLAGINLVEKGPSAYADWVAPQKAAAQVVMEMGK